MSENDMAGRPGIGASGTKIETILKVFDRRISLNRFEAEAHHDHCLHSTVASIERYGIEIGRQWETVPCLRGKASVRCKRYWLDSKPENLARTRAQLAIWARS